MNAHLLVFIVGLLISACLYWSANGRKEKDFANVRKYSMPFRIFAVFIAAVFPFILIFETKTLARFVYGAMELVLIYAIVEILSTRIEIINQYLLKKSVFTRKSIKLCDLESIKESMLSGDYIITSRYGEKIKIPMFIENSDSLITWIRNEMVKNEEMGSRQRILRHQ